MIIGITGSFGSGKTTVANIFKKYGYEVINADEIYHYIYDGDEKLKKEIMQEFGTLDRAKIKKIVFNDINLLQKLNKITHSIIIKEIKNKIREIKQNNAKKIRNKNNSIKIILDVPLLIEAKMQNMVDRIIVVKCKEKVQIERLLKKGRHSKEEIENIIKSQMPLEEKIKYADFVVDNSGTMEKIEVQVKSIILHLKWA